MRSLHGVPFSHTFPLKRSRGAAHLAMSTVLFAQTCLGRELTSCSVSLFFSLAECFVSLGQHL